MHSVLDENTDSSFDALNEALKSLKKSIKKLKEEIVSLGQKNKNFERIENICGLSDFSLTVILTFIEGKIFKSNESLVAYAGLDLSVRESGSSIHGKRSLSKRGCSVLRGALTRGAWGLIMHNEKFKQLNEYYCARNKHYFERLVIIARKILKSIYGVINNSSVFDADKILIPHLEASYKKI